MKGNQIKIVIDLGASSPEEVSFRPEISRFGMHLLSCLDEESQGPIRLPGSVVRSVEAVRFMKKFLEVHRYDPASIRITEFQPDDLESMFDAATYSLVHRFARVQNIEEAEQIINLAHFLNFSQLYNAVTLATLTIFYPKRLFNFSDPPHAKKQGIEHINLTGPIKEDIDPIHKNEDMDISNQKKEDLNKTKIYSFIIQYEQLINQSIVLQKQQLYHKHLKKHCQSITF